MIIATQKNIRANSTNEKFDFRKVKIPVKGTMVVGFDTYHDKEGDNRRASVGALVKTKNLSNL